MRNHEMNARVAILVTNIPIDATALEGRHDLLESPRLFLEIINDERGACEQRVRQRSKLLEISRGMSSATVAERLFKKGDVREGVFGSLCTKTVETQLSQMRASNTLVSNPSLNKLVAEATFSFSDET